KAGNYGYVLPLAPTPLPVRRQAGNNGTVFATLAPGTQFIVMDGPVCSNSSWWRHIKNNLFHLDGWLTEGDQGRCFVEPVLDVGAAEIAPATNGPVGVIAFVGLTDVDDSGHSTYDLYLTNGDGSHRSQLTHNVHTSDFSAPPAWSPDGKQVALE